ncbi:hypothetical protein V8F20_012521 [Naviculisporaceae sp. PSN 640]
MLFTPQYLCHFCALIPILVVACARNSDRVPQPRSGPPVSHLNVQKRQPSTCSFSYQPRLGTYPTLDAVLGNRLGTLFSLFTITNWILLSSNRSGMFTSADICPNLPTNYELASHSVDSGLALGVLNLASTTFVLPQSSPIIHNPARHLLYAPFAVQFYGGPSSRFPDCLSCPRQPPATLNRWGRAVVLLRHRDIEVCTTMSEPLFLWPFPRPTSY